MTLDDYFYYRERVRDLDPEALEKSGTKTPPADATDFALRVCYVILNSGMRWRVAKDIWERMRPSLLETGEIGDTFGHPGKKKSMDQVMREREAYFVGFGQCLGRRSRQCSCLLRDAPHIGGITKFHLAKNLGVDIAKPDVAQTGRGGLWRGRSVHVWTPGRYKALKVMCISICTAIHRWHSKPPCSMQRTRLVNCMTYQAVAENGSRARGREPVQRAAMSLR